MRKANFWHIGNVVGYLMEVDPREYARLDALGEEDEEGWRKALATHVQPRFQQMPEWAKAKLKDSLGYCLSGSPDEVRNLMYEVQDLPISYSNPIRMLALLWDVLWPGEDYHVDREMYEVCNDIDSGNEICPPVGGWPGEGTRSDSRRPK